ncbi:MAG: hypothetical protein WCJ10_05280, partial [Opitutaceae bacterium]
MHFPWYGLGRSVATQVFGTLLIALCPVLLRGASAPGPQNDIVDLGGYATQVYVDPQRGNDITGDGSKAHPVASLTRALEQSPGAGKRMAVLLSQGRYREPTFALKPDVDLFGGFAEPGGARCLNAFEHVGHGKIHVVHAAKYRIVESV